MGAVKNIMQSDEPIFSILDRDPDKSLEFQWPILKADKAASEQNFSCQQDFNTGEIQQTPEVASDTDSPTYGRRKNLGSAPSLWSSRLGYPSDWQSLPKFSSQPLEESIYEMNCTEALLPNICPVYEKYYRMLKMVMSCESHHGICHR